MTHRGWSKIRDRQIQHGGRTPSCKTYTPQYFRDGSADLDEILHDGADGVSRENCWPPFEISQIQDGGGRHLENPLNRDISATFWSISTKFGIFTRVGTPDPY